MSDRPGAPASDRPEVAPLSVEADLTVTVDGREVTVRSEGGDAPVLVDAPSVGAALALLRGSRSLPLPLERVGEGLDRSGLTVLVCIRGRTVARMGPGVDPGVLSGLLGVGPARVSPLGFLRALLS